MKRILTFKFRLSEEERIMLDSLAILFNRNRSDLVRFLVIKTCEKYKVFINDKMETNHKDVIMTE